MNDKQNQTGDHDVDEITMVRTLLVAPPPPDPRVTANARQQLLQRAAARQPSRRRRWALGLTATAAAAGTAAALAIVLPSSGHSGPAGDHGGLVTTEERPLGTVSGRSAQAFLLAAATQLAQAPVSTGRYWCTQGVSAQLDAIGPGGMELTPPGGGKAQPASPASDYRYSILDRQLMDACNQAGSTAIVGGYLQELGARPATAADAAAWRKAGSPQWLGWYAKGAVIPDHASARQPTSKPAGPAEPPLPSDPSPAQVRAYLLDNRIDARIPKNALNGQLFSQALALLENPVSPAVRAADFQLLASIPGVQMRQGVKDPLGRTGTALWLGNDLDEGMITMTIIDPATGMVLAYDFLTPQPGWVYAPGTVQAYTAFTSTWTNSLPS
jgi:hypothetical protein